MFWEHYKALLYKNWILWKRRKLESTLEILLPIFIFITIGLVRSSVSITEYEDSSYINNARYIHPELTGSGSFNFTKAVVFDFCADYISSGGDWIIGLAPNIEITNHLAEKVADWTLISNANVVYFEDNDDIDDYVESDDYEDNPKLCFAVVFDKAEASKYEYSIRFNQTYSTPEDARLGEDIDIFNTGLYEPTDPLITTPKPEFHWQFLSSGFIQIQNWVDNYILQEISGNQDAVIMAGFVPMHFDEWTDDSFLNNVSFLLGFFFIVTLMIPMCRMISQIVSEKEEKIKENMQMMGLESTAFWCSWLTYYVILYTLISLGIGLTFAYIIFNYTSFGLIFLLYLLFSYSCIAFGCLVCTIFSNSRIAVFIGLLLFVCGYFMYFVVDDKETSETTKKLASLIPNVALSLVMRNIVFYEKSSQGLNSDTINNSYDNYKYSTAYWMISIDIMIFTLLALYFEQVWPSEWGSKRPWYFLFQKSFWFGKTSQVENFEENFEKGPDEEEIIGTEKYKTMQIRGITKKFGNLVAVDGLNLDICHGQITAILGHNGAGKTTLISMITGLIPMTSGDMKTRGYFLSKDIDEIRKSLGVCPQHNVLYNELTVREHLYIYAVFKGVASENVENEVSETMIKFNLVSHAEAIAETLSGGEKRKLCIGIALIGNSKIVILDEPTSGLDVIARRQLWDILKTLRGNRIVILTTHYMQEADMLADRVIIMNEGKIVCSGTSHYLKNKFGVGYYLTLFKESYAEDAQIQDFIKNLLPNSALVSAANSEISFRLPRSDSSILGGIFDEIDNKKTDLGIKSYVISLSTLEEVFIKVSQQGLEEQSQDNESDYLLPQKKKEKKRFTDLVQIFKKRFNISTREYSIIILEILIPLIAIALGVWFMMIKDIVAEQDPYTLSVSQYDNPQDVIYYAANEVVETVIEELDSQEGITVTPSDIEFLLGFDVNTFELKDYEPNRMGSMFFFQMENDIYEPVIFHNQTAFQSLATFYQAISLAILRTYDPEIEITVHNYPFPVTQQMKELDTVGDAVVSSLIFGLAFSFIPAGVILTIVKENLNGVKYQHIISHCSLKWYWVGNFLWDYVKYLIFAGGLIIILFAFDVELFIEPSENAGALITVIFLYGISMILFTYCTTHLFSSTNSAQVITLMFSFVVGAILPVLLFVLWTIDQTRDFSRTWRWVARIFPNFCMSNSLIYLGLGDLIAYANGETSADPVFSLDRVGGDILLLGITSIVYAILLCIIESLSQSLYFKKLIDYSSPPPENSNIDADVQNEINLASQIDPDSTSVLLRDVSKVYTNLLHDNYTAVKHVSLVVPHGQCFVLLGSNGAGKTTAFKMINGQICSTGGEIFVSGKMADDADFYNALGYCPQFDALSESLTVSETLLLYAEFKSVVDPVATVKTIQKNFDLKKFKNVTVGSLSGGNKRKLSVSIAMIGNPSVIILDEPSCGMDPMTRRKLWNILAMVKRQDAGVIITTHSMDEAEALSDRIGIIVQGEVKCIGTPTALRSQLGNDLDFTVKIKQFKQEKVLAKNKELDDLLGEETIVRRNKRDQAVRILSPDIEDFMRETSIKKSLEALGDEAGNIFRDNLVTWAMIQVRGKAMYQWAREEFQDVQLHDHYFGIYHLKIKRDQSSLGTIFRKIESRYVDLKISEYTLNLTSLDTIYNRLNSSE